MTDITPEQIIAGPRLVDPDDDEPGDEILFVRNGWIRVTIAGVLYKLRRPFLGELRDLEAAIDAGAEELKALAEDLKVRERADQARADEIRAERDVEGVAPARIAELDDAATELALALQARFVEVHKKSRDLRAEWWRQAFEMLTPPGHEPPTSMPAWVGDVALQNQVITHWQSNPLARGAE
jgi:hypothetical protein